jgi:hypothetical protein
MQIDQPKSGQPKADPPKRKRRWFQFSLRTLLIVVTLLALPLCWLGLKVDEARQQQTAVVAIRKLGGFVAYDYQFDSQGHDLPGATLPGPAWLHSLLGDDFFRNVYGVILLDPSVKDADLEQLKALTQLRYVSVFGTNVTDVGVAKLQEALPDCKIDRSGLLPITPDLSR